MATGTGKTYKAFQIIWRLWKAARKKRIRMSFSGPALTTKKAAAGWDMTRELMESSNGEAF
jgi:hypothetical protein